MLQELNRIQSQHENGLHLLQLPTGYGKTYNVVQFMKQHAEDLESDSKFIYITQLKKNLSVSDLEKAVENENEYRKNVLVVKSIADQIVYCFKEWPGFVSKIPEQFKTQKFHELNKAVERYYRSTAPKKHTGESNSYMDANDDADLVEERREKLNRSEKEFRKEIKKELEKLSKSNKTILNEIRNPRSKFHWLKELYPTTFIDDYKIVVMTVDKFMTNNISLVKNSHSFYETKFLENYTLIIDEFDATKNVIEEFIIEQSYRQSAELLGLFNKLHRNWRLEDLNADLTNAMRMADRTMLMNRRQGGTAAFLFKQSSDIEKQHHTNLSYKLKEEEVDKSYNFLMFDGQYTTINDENKSLVCRLKKDTGNHVVLEYIDSLKTNKDLKRFQKCIYDIDKYLFNTKWYIEEWAKQYCKIKNENKVSDTFIITLEDAISTICEKLQLKNNEKNILMGFNQNTLLKKAKYALRNPCFYEKGVTYYDLRDNNQHADKTRIEITKIEDTPEKYLLHMAKTTNVIGISATAEVKSVLCNYDLEYLRNQLKADFHKTSVEMRYRIENELTARYGAYSEGAVKVHVSEVSTTCEEAWSIEKYCTKLLSNYIEGMNDGDKSDIHELIGFVANLIEETANVKENTKYEIVEADNTYVLEEYCKYFYAVFNFVFNNDIQSMLYLNMKLPKMYGPVFNKNLLGNIFSLVCEYYSPDLSVNNMVILDSKNYDENKLDLTKRLEDGEKLFVISTYNTLGAGQNLQHSVPEAANVVVLGEKDILDARYRTKDFDAIFLGPITNVLTNILEEGEFTRREAMKRVCQIQRLHSAYEISTQDKRKEIIRTFKRVGKEERVQNSPRAAFRVAELDSVRKSVERTVLQAIGRMCRAFNKNPNVYIWLDEKIMEQIDAYSLQDMIQIPEMQEVIRVLKERADVENEEKNRRLSGYEKVARMKSQRVFDYISETLTNINSQEVMDGWEELREFVLKNPTISESGLADYAGLISMRDLYMTNGKDDNTAYCYCQSGDYKSIGVSFTADKSACGKRFSEEYKGAVPYVANEEGTCLPTIMCYPGIKEEFEKRGYATSFKPDLYMMVPIIYNNIYKGALGEQAGKYIFENETGIKLHSISNSDHFEKFDYKIDDETYIDFKNWNNGTFVDAKKELDKIRHKMQLVGAKTVLVINVCNKFDATYMTVTESEGIFQIPCLLNGKGELSKRNIDKIIELLGERNVIYK